MAKRGSMSSPTCSSVIPPMWSPIRKVRYDTNTGKFDVLIEVIATNADKYFSEVADIGVYLSDLLGYHGNREETIERMDIHKFKEVK